jgi:hypothetical protein
MPDIIIPHGESRDGWICTSVNGTLVWIQAGAITTVTAATLEVLDHAMIDYSFWPADGSPDTGDAPAWARTGSIAWDGTNTITWANFNTILGSSVLIPGRDFDPLKLDSGVGYGLGNSDQGGGTFLDAFIDAFNFSFTVVMEFDGNFQLEYTEATFGTDLTVTAGVAGHGDGMHITDQNSGVILEPVGNTAAAASSKLALTITASSMYSAYNGASLMYADVPAQTVVDPDTPNQPTDIVFLASKLKRLTIYNPVKTEAEQRTLTT